MFINGHFNFKISLFGSSTVQSISIEIVVPVDAFDWALQFENQFVQFNA